MTEELLRLPGALFARDEAEVTVFLPFCRGPLGKSPSLIGSAEEELGKVLEGGEQREWERTPAGKVNRERDATGGFS